MSSSIFGWKFNQEIKEHILPISLQNLSFGYDFNQEIKQNVLPTQKLMFNSKFNKVIT
jgi:hypothetical protein